MPILLLQNKYCYYQKEVHFYYNYGVVFITISLARKNSSFDASTLDIILTHPKLLILNPSIGAMTNWQQKTLHYLLIAGYPASLRFPIMHPFTHLFP